MTLTITYPLTGSRAIHDLSQAECNRIITDLSVLNDCNPVPKIIITVAD